MKCEQNDLKNKQINDWFVLYEAEGKINPKGKINRNWKCRCKCGNEKIISDKRLRYGLSKMCTSCYRPKYHDKYPLEYSSWCAMKYRCNTPTAPEYKYYGERGIKVCDSWNNSFENFIKDMGRRPTKSHTIDRIDVNGDYTPENCRWATKSEQASNRRNNILMDINNEKITLYRYCKENNLNYNKITKRLRRGWNMKDALL